MGTPQGRGLARMPGTGQRRRRCATPAGERATPLRRLALKARCLVLRIESLARALGASCGLDRFADAAVPERTGAWKRAWAAVSTIVSNCQGWLAAMAPIAAFAPTKGAAPEASGGASGAGRAISSPCARAQSVVWTLATGFAPEGAVTPSARAADPWPADRRAGAGGPDPPASFRPSGSRRGSRARPSGPTPPARGAGP